MPYLDVVNFISDKIICPIAVYQVSGEYSMLKIAAAKGFLNFDQVMIEQLYAFKRAGASMIVTYHAKNAVKLLNKSL